VVRKPNKPTKQSRTHQSKYQPAKQVKVRTGFCDPPKWIIVRFDKKTKTWSMERHVKTREVYYWTKKESAELSLAAMKPDSQQIREVRRMYVQELKECNGQLQLVQPKALNQAKNVDQIHDPEPEPIAMELEPMAKTRTVSTGCLVEIYEDLENRKFAISTKAANEAEFLTEFAQAIASAPTADWNTRMKEFLPLVVDMCCKFRGYKAEKVFERRELVAGDLEIPS
jgi:hypothetical protein